MKSEQKFLTSMWTEINAREWEENQKLIVHELNKRLFMKEVLAYGIIMMLFAIGSLITFFIEDNPSVVYVVGALLFLTTFFIEKLIYSKPQGGSIDENRNHY